MREKKERAARARAPAARKPATATPTAAAAKKRTGLKRTIIGDAAAIPTTVVARVRDERTRKTPPTGKRVATASILAEG